MGNEKSRFLKRDDGTIYDSLTSVTWMANDSWLDMDKEVSYAETEEYLKKMNEKKVGGYDDWRIPTVHEASSIYDKEKLNKEFFPDNKYKAIFICGIGYGDESNLHSRAPRLDFTEACKIL